MIINTLAGRTGPVTVNEIKVMAFRIRSLEMGKWRTRSDAKAKVNERQ